MALIYVLGDSHTEALGPQLRKLLSEHDVRYQFFRGASTRRAAAKMAPPAGADAVVVELGGNDFSTAGGARKALVAALRLRNPGVPIIWFGPAHATNRSVGPRHDAQAVHQRRQLPELGVRWVDSRPWTKTGHRADGVHFTQGGYRPWAAKIATTTRDALRSASSRTGPLWGLVAAVGAAWLWWAQRQPMRSS